MNEKRRFKITRHWQIHDYGQTELEGISRFEQKWGNLCYLPLAVPSITDSRFVDWYFEKAEPVYKVGSDVAGGPNYADDNFLSINVQFTQPKKPADTVWTSNIHPEWVTEFPEMYEKILTYFPIKKIHHLSFWSSTRTVVPHRDQAQFIDGPLSLRIKVYDENPEPTLYLSEALPDQPPDAEKFQCILPDTTNSFMWNNLRTQHSSTFDPAYKKILVILNACEYDWDRIDALFEASVSKFDAKYFMHSKYQLSDFI